MKNAKSSRSFIYNTVIFEDVRSAPLYRFIYKFMNPQWPLVYIFFFLNIPAFMRGHSFFFKRGLGIYGCRRRVQSLFFLIFLCKFVISRGSGPPPPKPRVHALITLRFFNYNYFLNMIKGKDILYRCLINPSYLNDLFVTWMYII